MLELDYTNVLDQTVSNQGIPKVAFEKAAVSSRHVVEDIEKAHAAGKLGFGNLPDDAKAVKPSPILRGRINIRISCCLASAVPPSDPQRSMQG